VTNGASPHDDELDAAALMQANTARTNSGAAVSMESSERVSGWRGEDWAAVLETSGAGYWGNEGGKRRGCADARIGQRGRGRRVSRRRGRVPQRAERTESS
jgi:hypothetical protein